ncbi:MAG: GNAT family protein [Rhodothermales bacterium]
MKALTNDLIREGRRIRLTRLTLGHIRHHYQWNNDPVLNHFDSETPFEPESYLSFARRFESMLLGTGHTQYFEVQTLDGTPIGVAHLGHLSSTHQHASIGVTIGARDLWGQGYGREALELVMAFAFDELGVHRIGAQSFAFNTAWKHLLEQTGFVAEGRQRDYLFRDGQYWDREAFSMLAAEYQMRSTPAPALRQAA